MSRRSYGAWLAAAALVLSGTACSAQTSAGGGTTPSSSAPPDTTAPARPVITTQPASRTVQAGSRVSFSVVAAGAAPLAYQWAHDAAALPGETAATLTLAAVTTADAGTYTVTVSNDGGAVMSDLATLAVTSDPASVTTAPSIVTAPVSQTVAPGSDVTFTVVAAGTAPLSYGWTHGATRLAGATSATLALAGVSAADAGSYTVSVSNGAGTKTASATLTVEDTPASGYAQYALTGFASVAPATTGGGEIAETDAAYVKVTTPAELAKALVAANKTAGAVKVIEIMNDLDLGFAEVGAGVTGLASSPFSMAATPLLHPVLVKTGVSVIDIKAKSGLTIFSANGATLRHALLNIKGTSNIIIRNLRFDELWEWDESTKGKYDRNDWDFIDIGNGSVAHHVWIDHCTFTKSYDGIVDIKGGAYAITLSWNKVVGDDGATNPDSFVRRQLAALESCTTCPFYRLLRDNGFSLGDVARVHEGHDKGHLIGATALDAQNAAHTVTFHHDLFKNVWDRHPRLRAGNVHVYNIVVDAQEELAAKRLRDAKVAAMSAAAASTFKSYSFNPPLNGSISTEGGAVLVERSVYLDSLWPLRNNQTDVTDPQYTGKVEALDTIYTFHETNGTTTSVRGDSTDASSPLGPRQAPAIGFSWNLAGGVLPYAYTADDPASLRALLDAGAGAGALTWPKANWLKVKY